MRGVTRDKLSNFQTEAIINMQLQDKNFLQVSEIISQ